MILNIGSYNAPTFLGEALIILFLGDVKVLNQFDFEDNTAIKSSCSTVLRNKMLVFGGWRNFSSQISTIDSCYLKRIGTLPFSFDSGGCQTFGTNEDSFSLLCFPDGSGTPAVPFLSNFSEKV